MGSKFKAALLLASGLVALVSGVAIASPPPYLSITGP